MIQGTNIPLAFPVTDNKICSPLQLSQSRGNTCMPLIVDMFFTVIRRRLHSKRLRVCD